LVAVVYLCISFIKLAAENFIFLLLIFKILASLQTSFHLSLNANVVIHHGYLIPHARIKRLYSKKSLNLIHLGKTEMLGQLSVKCSEI